MNQVILLVDSTVLNVSLNIPDTFLDAISLEKWKFWPVELENESCAFPQFQELFLTIENAEYAKQFFHSEVLNAH